MTEVINVKVLHDEPKITEKAAGLAFVIGAAVIAVYIQRKLMEPDFFLTFKMRTLNGISRYADNRAAFWRDVSEKASNLYLATRP
jgi:hypothetical protein